jgi:predicted GNAT superfamily acetyltransferase
MSEVNMWGKYWRIYPEFAKKNRVIFKVPTTVQQIYENRKSNPWRYRAENVFGSLISTKY